MATQAPTPPIRIRRYQDVLTTTLHRRFLKAAGVSLGVCYLEAFAIGEKSSWFWSWFPVSKTGIRMLLLFIPALAVYILRVAQMHVGARTTLSPFHTFRQYLFSYAYLKNTIQTIGWYMFSAWWFSEVYLWSALEDADLNWLTKAKSWDRPRLNERPIYLRTVLFIFAMVQSFLHLHYDYDQIPFPITKTLPESASDQRAHLVVPPLVQLKTDFPHLLSRSIIRAIIISAASLVMYPILFRRRAWAWALFFAKMMWKLPKTSPLPPIQPLHITLLLRTCAAGFMLLFLWEVVNRTFSLYLAQEPLKRGKPLTERTRDPNGVLLNGLKAKKDITKAFAFWELIYISQRFTDRRKTFFEDIDRKGGSVWSQIMAACLGEIGSVRTRISGALKPPVAAAVIDDHTNPKPKGNPAPLKKIAASLNESNIYRNPPIPSSNREAVGYATKQLGQHPLPKGMASPVSPRRLMQVAHNTLSEQQRQALNRKVQDVKTTVDEGLISFIRSYLGHPFRQTVQRKAAVVIVGSPYGDLGIIVDAIDSLARLTVCSLSEDAYGKVQKDVPTIIKTYTETINEVEAFKRNIPIDWTDVEVTDRENITGLKEVDVLLATLRGALRDVLNAFGPYTDDLAISIADVRMAREAIVSGQPAR